MLSKFENQYLKIIAEQTQTLTPDEISFLKAHKFFGEFGPNDNVGPNGQKRNYNRIMNNTLLANQSVTGNGMIAIEKQQNKWHCWSLGGRGKMATFLGSRNAEGVGETPKEAIENFIKNQLDGLNIIFSKIEALKNDFVDYQELLNNIKL